MSTSRDDRLESVYYKKHKVNYNKINHAYVHNKHRAIRRQQNIDKFGVEREPLSKDEIEALIHRQEKEMELKQKRANRKEVKEFDEKDWFGDDADSDLQEVSDSDDEPTQEKRVRFMESSLDFQEDDDGRGSSHIIISNLHRDVNPKKFRNTFEEAGRIKSLCFPRTPARKSLGWAIIEYFSPDAANTAVEDYHMAQNRGKTLHVMKFNMINDFFVIQQDDDELELEDAQEVKNTINSKQWDSASTLLKEKLLLYLRWRKEDAKELNEREQIIFSLLEKEEKEREESAAAKKAAKASKKRKRTADKVREFTGGKKRKKRKKNRKGVY